MNWWIYPVYFVDLAAMVFLSFFLGNLVDMLDKKTKISGAFIGGVLLAAVTSLPELFTAFSAVIMVRNPELVVGDIMGSILFDLVCLGLETFLFVKHFKDSKFQAWHWMNGTACLIMYALCAYGFFAPAEAQLMLGDINVISILIFVLYILTLVFQPKESGEDSEELSTEEKKADKMDNWSLKKIIFWFIVSSLLLIGTSIFLTYLTDWIKSSVPFLSGSVAGALLLGVGTSIPEIVSTAQLFHKKNYDAGYGNMIGSCTFDFAILAFSDFISWHYFVQEELGAVSSRIQTHGIFLLDADTFKFVIFGIVATIGIIALSLLRKYTKIYENKKKLSYVITGAIAAILVAGYFLTFFLPWNPLAA